MPSKAMSIEEALDRHRTAAAQEPPGGPQDGHDDPTAPRPPNGVEGPPAGLQGHQAADDEARAGEITAQAPRGYCAADSADARVRREAADVPPSERRQIVQTMLGVIERGEDATAACARFGVARSSVWSWMLAEDPSALSRARTAAAWTWADIVGRIVDRLMNGEIDPATARVAGALARQLAERHAPNMWGTGHATWRVSIEVDDGAEAAALAVLDGGSTPIPT